MALHVRSLQRLCDSMAEYFAQKGLLSAQRAHGSSSVQVKLHVTLMNTRYREDPEGALSDTPAASQASAHADVRDGANQGTPSGRVENRWNARRESFDATNILKVLHVMLPYFAHINDRNSQNMYYRDYFKR